MDLRSGYPLWLVKSGLPFSYPKLEKNLRADVIILGGGISGALTAHYLIANNISCAIIDGRTIGLGSTCASTALLQYQVDVPLSKLATMIGKQQAIRAYTLCAESVDELEKICQAVYYPGFERKKTLYYASYARHRLKENKFESRFFLPLSRSTIIFAAITLNVIPFPPKPNANKAFGRSTYSPI